MGFSVPTHTSIIDAQTRWLCSAIDHERAHAAGLIDEKRHVSLAASHSAET